MAQAMAVKQQKYDAGYNAIQSEIDFLGKLDIIKPEDKAYFTERTNKLIEQVNNYGNMDLSSNGVTKQIRNHIKQTLDPVVMNALTSTAKFRSFQKEVATVKEKNPDKYSVVNEMYALRPFQQWIMDGRAGTSLGNMQYTPYVDVQKKYQDIIKDMWVNHKDQVFDFPDPANPGRIIRKTWSGLDPTEVEAVVSGYMSAEDQQQLGINGWFKYGLATPEQSAAKAQEYYDRASSEYDGEIAKLKKDAQVQTGVKLKETQDKISSYERAKMNLSSTLMAQKNSPEAVGRFFETNNLIKGLQNMHSFKQTGEEFKSDEYYFDVQNLNLEREKLDYNKAIEEAKLALEYYKVGLNSDGTPKESVDGITVSSGTGTPTEQSVESHMQSFDAESGRINIGIENILKEKYGDEYSSRVDALKARSERENVPFEELVFKELEGDGMSPQEAELQKSYFAQQAIKEELLTVFNLQKEGVLKSLTNENGVVDTIFEDNLGKNLNGGGTLKEYWLSKGLDTKEKVKNYLNNNPQEKQDLLKQIYGDFYITKTINTGYKTPEEVQESKYYLDQLASLFGEKVQSVEWINLPRYNNQGVRNPVRRDIQVKGAPKTAEFLKNIKTKGAYGDSAIPFYTDSLEDSPVIGNTIGYSNYQRTYIDKVGEVFNRFAVNKEVTVDPSNKNIYNKLANLAAKSFEINPKVPITFSKSPDGNTIEVKQTINKADGTKVEGSSALIPLSDFNATGLNTMFDTSRNTGIARKDLYIPFTKSVGKIYDNNVSDDNLKVQGLSIMGINKEQVTKQGFQKLIDRLSTEKYQPYKQVLNKLIERPENIIFSTPSKSKVDEISRKMNLPLSQIRIPINVKYEGVNVGSFPVSMSNYTTGTLDAILQSPQTYLYKTLEVLINDALANGSNAELDNLVINLR